MPDFQGIELHRRGSRSGLLLRLARAPDFDAVVPLAGGFEVQVKETVRAVVIRSRAEKLASLWEGVEIANRALDLLGLRRRPPLRLVEVRESHAAWHRRPDGGDSLSILAAHVARLTFSARVEVRGPDGEPVVAEPEKFPAWEQSTRYFRMAESSSDLFDSFRNVYLAIESILSEIRPRRHDENGRYENEEKWFKASLSAAGELVELDAFAPATLHGNPIHAIWSELVKAFRNAVFHGKSGEDSMLPEVGSDRARMLEAKNRYASMYLAVAGARLYGQGIDPGGLNLAQQTRLGVLEEMQSGTSIGITSDTSPFDPSDERLSPRGETCEFAPAREVRVPGYEDFRCVRAVFGRLALDRVQRVGRFGSVGSDDVLKLFDSLDGALDLSGLDRLEVTLAQDLKGRPGLREDYSS